MNSKSCPEVCTPPPRLRGGVSREKLWYRVRTLLRTKLLNYSISVRSIFIVKSRLMRSRRIFDLILVDAGVFLCITKMIESKSESVQLRLKQLDFFFNGDARYFIEFHQHVLPRSSIITLFFPQFQLSIRLADFAHLIKHVVVVDETFLLFVLRRDPLALSPG